MTARPRYTTMTTTTAPRPVADPPESCEQCRARDLAADPDAPSTRHDCDCTEATR